MNWDCEVAKDWENMGKISWLGLKTEFMRWHSSLSEQPEEMSCSEENVKGIKVFISRNELEASNSI